MFRMGTSAKISTGNATPAIQIRNLHYLRKAHKYTAVILSRPKRKNIEHHIDMPQQGT
jgi:hypothetical protein